MKNSWKGLLAFTIFGFLLTVSSVYALGIQVNVDKKAVFYEDSFTVTANITNFTGQVKYRIAVIAPKGIIIPTCDKNGTTIDGSLSLTCQVPSAATFNSLGVPAALTRAVVPLRVGVAVKDPADQTTIKSYTLVVAFNKEKYKGALENLTRDLNNFANQTTRFKPTCDNVVQKAQRFNQTVVINKCQLLQAKIDNLATNATAAANRAQQLAANITVIDVQQLKDLVKDLRLEINNFKRLISDVKDAVRAVQWQTLRPVAARVGGAAR